MNQPKLSAAWLICLSAGLYFFYAFMQLNLLNSISQQLLQTWHINAKQLSYLSVVSLIASAILFIPAGFALDKYSIRKIMMVSAFICIIATLAFALAHSYKEALIARFFIGTAYTIALLGCIRLINIWLSKQLAFGLGIVTTIGLTGGLFAQTPIVELSHFFGWRNALLFTIPIGILVWGILWLTVKDGSLNPHRVSEYQRYHYRKALKLIWLNKYNWLCAAYSCLLNSPVLFMGDLWGNMYLVQSFHMIPGQAATIISFMFAGMMVGCPVIGWISDYFNNRSLFMLLSSFLLLLLITLLFFAQHLSVISLMILFFACGVLTTSQALTYPLLMKTNSSAHIGLATGFATTLIMMGNALLQYLFGVLLDTGAHNHVAFNYFNIKVFIMFTFVVCLFIAMRLVTLAGDQQQALVVLT